jgi:hypothetical protein
MNELLDTLYELWLYDVHVFSKPWIYWCLCIPALFYLKFFFLKWTVLTAPLWLPVVIIIGLSNRLKINLDESVKIL